MLGVPENLRRVVAADHLEELIILIDLAVVVVVLLNEFFQGFLFELGSL